MDRVYNFGMFSFSKPNFVYRFVKGETDYALAGYPFEYFIPEYVERNSKVVEQVLNLSQRQAESLYLQLEWLRLPQNREYRYNYVLDNCATRPRDMIEKVTGGLNYPQPADTTLTFRDMMRSYSGNYPWYQFGIDLALGSGIDYRLDAREQMFAPIYLMNAFQGSAFIDESGHRVPLVKEKIVLFDGSESPVLPPTPWYLTPLFAGLVLLLVAVGVTYVDRQYRRVSRWFDTLFFGLCFLGSIVIYFLIFCSEHPTTTINYNGLWLTPLSLIAAVLPYVRSMRGVVRAYHILNLIAILLFLITALFGIQHYNIAFYPLIATSALRSVNYILIYRVSTRTYKPASLHRNE